MFDPYQVHGFTIGGIRYEFDADPDTPTLWRVLNDTEWIEVSTFGPGWTACDVLDVATADAGRAAGG